MLANIVFLHIPLTKWVGSKGQNVFFYESGHAAYRIKGNVEYNTMQTDFLHYYPLDPYGGIKRSHHFFPESCHAVNQIKGKSL